MAELTCWLDADGQVQRFGGDPLPSEMLTFHLEQELDCGNSYGQTPTIDTCPEDSACWAPPSASIPEMAEPLPSEGTLPRTGSSTDTVLVIALLLGAAGIGLYSVTARTWAGRCAYLVIAVAVLTLAGVVWPA